MQTRNETADLFGTGSFNITAPETPPHNTGELILRANRQAQELELLHKIRSALVSNFDPSNVFHAVVDSISETFGYNLICIYLLENNVLKLTAQRGYRWLNPEVKQNNGISWVVVRTGRPVLLTDVKKVKEHFITEPGVKSHITVPLIRRGNEIVGTLTVETINDTTLNERDLRLCLAAADHVTLALEQNRLYLSEQRRADQLAALNKIGRELVSLLEVQAICDRITGAVRQKLNYYCVGLGLAQENHLVFTVGAGDDPLPVRRDFSMSLTENSLPGYAYHNAEMVLVHDVTKDNRYQTLPFAPNTISQIVLPLRDANAVLGVLDIHSDKPNAFDDDEVLLLKTLADQTSIAIANAMRFQDIKRQKEELAVANKALSEANRLKNEFLANVSHELRTPLNSIMGYIDMVQSGFYGDVPDNFQDPLERVLRNSHRLLGLINDVLDLAKLEAGRDSLQIEQFWLEEIVRHNFEILREQAEAKGLKYECVVAPNTPKMVFNDQKRLGQVLNNLLSNAIKFTHHGDVTIEISPANTQKGAPGYQIKVSDTGIGISSEDYDSIFESFRQVDGSTTRTFGGAGMGLTICLKLVRMMQGTIRVESQVAQGSVFTVVLPVYASAPPEPVAPIR
jgi:signal transduction histidine kinase